MSLPFYEITCSNCDYSENYAYNIEYHVEGVSAEIRGILTQGWCHDCQTVLTIFAPGMFTAEKAQEEIDERCEIIRDLTTGFWGSLRFKLSRERREQIGGIEENIRAFEQWKEFIGNKKANDRCLTCGSYNVQRVDLPYRNSNVVSLGVNHKCGGGIRAQERGRIAYGDRPRVHCDLEGNILLDER